MVQFNRKIIASFSGEGELFTVNAGNATDQQIRIRFQASKGIESTTNTSEISIFNLSESSRNRIGRELTNVSIDAGYLNAETDTVGRIFGGQVRDVKHMRDGADVVSIITVGDGDSALRSSFLNRTFPAGTEVSTVVTALIDQLIVDGVIQGEVVLPEGLDPYARPYTVAGSVKSELDKLSRTHQFYWSIQNGVIEVIAGNKPLPRITVLNSSTGMIGYPIITDNGVEVKALINPEVRAGRMIKVESNFIDLNSDGGLYRVGSIEYNADNRGTQTSPFFMTIHAEAIKDDEVDEGVQ